MSVIPKVIKKGFMGMARKSFVIVLTDQRLIFAHITSDMLKQSVADARRQCEVRGVLRPVTAHRIF